VSALRIGVDLGGTKIESILMDPAGTIVDRRRDAAPRDDYRATVDALVAIVAHWDAVAGARVPVGIGTPGAWDANAGVMKNCNSTWLNGRPLATDLARRLGARVRLANDANCFALSEAVDGAGSARRVVFGVILGTGVGGGIVVDGRPLEGRNGIAGEWGHTPLPYLGCDSRAAAAERELEARLVARTCYCGRERCVEMLLSGPGLERMHRDVWSESRTAPDIARAADAYSARTMALYARLLARSLAQIVNVLDPDVIVLGGGLSQVASLYHVVPSLWLPYVFSDTATTPVLPPQHGDASGVRGAAWLWPPG
jgi:fructokinase